MSRNGGGYQREDGLRMNDQTGVVNYSARAANALIAIAVILCLIALSFEIPFFIKFFEWENDCCGSIINTYTKIIKYTETPTITTCVLGNDCGTQQLWNTTGTIVALGTSTALGNSFTQCYLQGPDNVDAGDIFLCSKIYIFDGSGSVTAGKITAFGDYFVPGNQSDVDAWRLSTWAVTGGTGSVYFKANGGEVTFTTAADAASTEGTITFNYVA